MKNFIKDTAERAIKTFAQSLIAVGLVGAKDIVHADWLNALAIAALAAVISVLTSIVSANFGDPSTAGVTTNTKIVTMPVPAPVEQPADQPVVDQSTQATEEVK